ncbi:sel1 repeat family protein [Lonepinella koalarum]|uniref:tetratricopeptide repeat protein n=1 Tax=Lonepinella koalarum TaxID=53417 RepID=UPI0011E46973|nr:SEL1-like repeat protein [Lonepinella koalarum]TYG34669.1 sel1 repeat family protein [Lonepinella koalarum]
MKLKALFLSTLMGLSLNAYAKSVDITISPEKVDDKTWYAYIDSDTDEIPTEKKQKIFAALSKAIDENMTATAAIRLGELYYYGIGIETDKSLAAFWYIRAAELGDSYAQFWLGKYYLLRSDPHDSVASLAWFEKAAAQGYAPAICGVGFHYQNGISSDDKNVPPLLAIDEKKAKALFEKGEKLQEGACTGFAYD